MSAILNEVFWADKKESRYVGIKELVCGLRKDLYSRYCVTMLKAFIDDSGSGGDSVWYVLAGYVGTVANWIEFETEWKKVLDTEPRIEYFKSTEAESLKRQFSTFTKKQKDAKMDSLIEVIQKQAQRAVSVRVRQEHYNSIVKGKVPPLWDNAYYFLFLSLIS